ncbi:hypothetical protein A258_10995 [Pseudomonas syringae pv. actinidiae ICMP 19104]|nr:hypothetical protein A258_10995 [Pseudomonas syringae pv. actinidiae ICMP 19104]
MNHELVEKIGGIGEIEAELPMDWFALYDYGSGLVIQSGPTPEAAPTDQPKPARLVHASSAGQPSNGSNASISKRMN